MICKAKRPPPSHSQILSLLKFLAAFIICPHLFLIGILSPHSLKFTTEAQRTTARQLFPIPAQTAHKLNHLCFEVFSIKESHNCIQ